MCKCFPQPFCTPGNLVSQGGKFCGLSCQVLRLWFFQSTVQFSSESTVVSIQLVYTQLFMVVWFVTKAIPN